MIKHRWIGLSKSKKIVALSSAGVLMLAALMLLFGRGADPQDYVEVMVKKGNVQPTILSTGTVSPENRLEIKPPIAGRIDEVLVREGQIIKKGQMLVNMSSTERAALLDAARAKGPKELQQWETYYKAAPIMAPIDGEIIVRSAEPGQTVTSADVILVMSDRLTVKARVDETDIGNIKLGQKVDIVLDAYPDGTIKASVDKIAYDSKTVNNVTTYIVDVLPDDVPDYMRSGMTANVTFYLEPKNDVLVLPRNAVLIKDKQSVVMLPPVKNPVQRAVVTGMADDTKIEVVSGLNEGDNVLIERLKWNADGDSDRSNPFFPGKPKAKKSK